LLIGAAGLFHGEEPYTLAIVLTEWAIANPGFASACWPRNNLEHCAGKAARGLFTAEVFRPVSARAAAEVFHAQPRS